MNEHSATGFKYHRKIYLGLLVFVVAAGLPIVGVPSLRQRLRTRVVILRSAALAEPLLSPPASAKVGENHEPFPKEYERAPVVRPAYQPLAETPSRAPFKVVAGGDESGSPAQEVVAPVLLSSSKGGKTAATPGAVTAAAAEAPAAAGGGAADSTAQKGEGEQEAYHILVDSSPTVAGMIKGSDASLKFQDWSATSLGQESYNVSLTFVQTGDNIVRKYIWTVKVATKEVVPLNHYAREISK